MWIFIIVHSVGTPHLGCFLSGPIELIPFAMSQVSGDTRFRTYYADNFATLLFQALTHFEGC